MRLTKRQAPRHPSLPGTGSRLPVDWSAADPENMTSGWIGVIRISSSRACALMESESQCRCEGSTGVDPFRRDACRSWPAPHSGPPRAAWPAWRGNRNRRCAAERAAGRHRGLAGLRRTCGIRGETGHEGVQRFPFGGYSSRWVLRGDPSGGPNTPAPAVYSQIHKPGRWPAATLRPASRFSRDPSCTRP